MALTHAPVPFISILALALASCSGTGRVHQLRAGGGGVGTTTTAPPSPPLAAGAGATAAAPAANGKPSVDSIVAQALAAATLLTPGSGTASTCTPVAFKVAGGGTAIEGASVSFAIVSTSGAKDSGKLDHDTAASDVQGIATVTYCSGMDPGTMLITAKVGQVSANSALITVTKASTYTITFSKVDLPVHTLDNSNAPPPPMAPISPMGKSNLGDPAPSPPPPAPAPPPATLPTEQDTAPTLGLVYLNTLDSGPHDCAHLTFNLSLGGQAAVGRSVRFATQSDYPAGFKVAEKGAKGMVSADPASGRSFGYYDATSDANGDLLVPVCAGSGLGTVALTGTFIADSGVTYTVQSPFIRITSGVVDWLDMTLTYDRPDGHTLLGYFNTNATDARLFTVKVGSRNYGNAITDYPVFVASETGKILLDRGGILSETDNTATFHMEALHLQDERPHPTLSLQEPGSQTVCDPEALAKEPAGVNYPDLAMNWRNTIVYGIRGQEFFHDAFGDGVFHPGCTGFWDKNQNGVYDDGDVITYDPFGDGKFHGECDWFIDMPSPFIDVNENGVYEPGVDKLIGDSFTPPNGKWDSDTIIWKSDHVPIYMGTSPYSMVHSAVTHGDVGSMNDTLGSGYFKDLQARGLFGEYPSPAGPYAPQLWSAKGPSLGNVDLWPTLGGKPSSANGEVWSYFFAHSTCGTPLPGGTKVQVNFTDLTTPAYGDRPFFANFFIQPLDQTREPSRRLLADGSGASSATINFDVVDHPAAAGAYPVIFKIGVPDCTHACGGDVLTPPGVACDGKATRAALTSDTDTINVDISFDAVSSCNCAVGAAEAQGSCTCPKGKSNVGGTCQ